MMGAGNPITGAKTRQSGSSFCPACGRWHRPGNLCASKGFPLSQESLLTRQAPAEPSPTAEDHQEGFVEASGHLQHQNTAYLDALRMWLERYGR